MGVVAGRPGLIAGPQRRSIRIAGEEHAQRRGRAGDQALLALARPGRSTATAMVSLCTSRPMCVNSYMVGPSVCGVCGRFRRRSTAYAEWAGHLMVTRRDVKGVWLVAEPGGYAVGWGTLALINAGLAQGKNRSGLAWFLVSLLLGPLATFILLLMEKLPSKS